VKYGFILDNRKCIGCHACTVACKSEHEVPIGVNRTWVKYIEKGVFPDSRRFFTVMRCNHCENPPCVDICPVGAMFQREDGIVDFNNDRCIGCKSCTMACPYDSIYIHPETSTAAKCNFCAHRIDQGLNPACVNICPEEAIICGDMDDPNSNIRKIMGRNQVQARKIEKGTTPKLYYINSEASALHPMAAPPTNVYQQTEQAAGVGHYAKFAQKRVNENKEYFIAQGNSSKAPYEKENPASQGVILANAGGIDANLMKGNIRRTHDAPAKGPLWNWELPGYLWSKAIAAGVFIISAVHALFYSAANTTPWSESNVWFNLSSSFTFLILTTAFLIKDLDRPERFIYVILRPQFKSWLTRGGYILSTFGFFVALVVFGKLISNDTIVECGWWGGMIAGIILAVYTAFLLAQAKGRDFWQSPLMPVHMLVHTLMAGIAFFMITAVVNPIPDDVMGALKPTLIGAIIVNLLVVLFELIVPHPTSDAKLAVKMITGKKFGGLFYGITLFAGNLLPLLLLFTGVLPLEVTGLLVLLGIWVTEHIWVKAPQMVALS
jgi:Fe-S-cluster-containing dehydrogenase component/formate-dependent nitrite reductase membrane component NrfD